MAVNDTSLQITFRNKFFFPRRIPIHFNSDYSFSEDQVQPTETIAVRNYLIRPCAKPFYKNIETSRLISKPPNPTDTNLTLEEKDFTLCSYLPFWYLTDQYIDLSTCVVKVGRPTAGAPHLDVQIIRPFCKCHLIQWHLS